MRCSWLRARRWRLRGRVFDGLGRGICLRWKGERIWARRKEGWSGRSGVGLWRIGGRVMRVSRYW